MLKKYFIFIFFCLSLVYGTTFMDFHIPPVEEILDLMESKNKEDEENFTMKQLEFIIDKKLSSCFYPYIYEKDNNNEDANKSIKLYCHYLHVDGGYCPHPKDQDIIQFHNQYIICANFIPLYGYKTNNEITQDQIRKVKIFDSIEECNNFKDKYNDFFEKNFNPDELSSPGFFNPWFTSSILTNGVYEGTKEFKNYLKIIIIQKELNQIYSIQDDFFYQLKTKLLAISEKNNHNDHNFFSIVFGLLSDNSTSTWQVNRFIDLCIDMIIENNKTIIENAPMNVTGLENCLSQFKNIITQLDDNTINQIQRSFNKYLKRRFCGNNYLVLPHSNTDVLLINSHDETLYSIQNMTKTSYKEIICNLPLEKPWDDQEKLPPMVNLSRETTNISGINISKTNKITSTNKLTFEDIGISDDKKKESRSIMEQDTKHIQEDTSIIKITEPTKSNSKIFFFSIGGVAAGGMGYFKLSKIRQSKKTKNFITKMKYLSL